MAISTKDITRARVPTRLRRPHRGEPDSLPTGVPPRDISGSRLHFPDFGFRALFKVALDPLVLVDGKGVILAVNPPAQLLFDYGAEELRGTHLGMLIAESHRSEHWAWLDACLQADQCRADGCEIPGLRRDGSVVPLALWVRQLPRGCGGQLVCTIRECGNGMSALPPQG